MGKSAKVVIANLDKLVNDPAHRFESDAGKLMRASTPEHEIYKSLTYVDIQMQCLDLVGMSESVKRVLAAKMKGGNVTKVLCTFGNKRPLRIEIRYCHAEVDAIGLEAEGAQISLTRRATTYQKVEINFRHDRLEQH